MKGEARRDYTLLAWYDRRRLNRRKPLVLLVFHFRVLGVDDVVVVFLAVA